jgi:hypothetical protein
MSRYAAKVVDGLVVQVIRGDAAWAQSRLGGAWVGVDQKVGRGWEEWQPGRLRPPSPYPSWEWDGKAWKAPKRKPLLGGPYVWDEPTLSWVVAEDVL